MADTGFPSIDAKPNPITEAVVKALRSFRTSPREYTDYVESLPADPREAFRAMGTPEATAMALRAAGPLIAAPLKLSPDALRAAEAAISSGDPTTAIRYHKERAAELRAEAEKLPFKARGKLTPEQQAANDRVRQINEAANMHHTAARTQQQARHGAGANVGGWNTAKATDMDDALKMSRAAHENDLRLTPTDVTGGE